MTISQPVSIDPPPVPAARARGSFRASSGSFAIASVIGAVFAGFVTESRTGNGMATATAAVVVFVAAFVGLHLLQLVVHACLQLAKVALPAALILALGCALDWPWAEAAATWSIEMAGRGIEYAGSALASVRLEQTGR